MNLKFASLFTHVLQCTFSLLYGMQCTPRIEYSGCMSDASQLLLIFHTVTNTNTLRHTTEITHENFPSGSYDVTGCQSM
jgi:hypothetical protein